jgi:putative holliday junction resolvase
MTVTLLACDFGLKHIGIAVGQTVTRTASPAGVVRARDGSPDWRALDAMIVQWRPDLLVVGLPLNMDGSASEMSAHAERFAERLRQRYRLPVETVDERLTSFEARGRTDDPDRSHAIAAQLIAESWLSRSTHDADVRRLD